MVQFVMDFIRISTNSYPSITKHLLESVKDTLYIFDSLVANLFSLWADQCPHTTLYSFKTILCLSGNLLLPPPPFLEMTVLKTMDFFIACSNYFDGAKRLEGPIGIN